MKKAVAPALAAGVLLLAVPTQANAVVDPTNPCNIQGWYVNDDEGGRKPERKLEGFVFEDKDLIHHATNFPLRFLQPGHFAYTGTAPDQPSFFSVEVRDLTTDAYGTLRWIKSTGKWSIDIGAATLPSHNPNTTPGHFEDSSPVELLKGKVSKWGPFTAATRVVSFGVGYTNSPASAVKTTVTAVNFLGRVYTFKCDKPVDPSPTTSPSASQTPSSTPSSSTSSSPTASPSSSVSPTQSGTPTSTASATTSSSSASTSPSSGVAGEATNGPDGGALPVTGNKAIWIGVIGTAVAAIGGIFVFLGRKRRQGRHS